MNPLKMSPDRKIVWFMLFIGTAKVFKLDEYIPLPESEEVIVTVFEHGNQEVQELARELRQIVDENNDGSFIGMLSMSTALVYVVLKKVKEIVGVINIVKKEKE